MKMLTIQIRVEVEDERPEEVIVAGLYECGAFGTNSDIQDITFLESDD